MIKSHFVKITELKVMALENNFFSSFPGTGNIGSFLQFVSFASTTTVSVSK